MKGLFIKGMEMPESCAYCYFKHAMLNDLVRCELLERILLRTNESHRLEGCPLYPCEIDDAFNDLSTEIPANIVD